MHRQASIESGSEGGGTLCGVAGPHHSQCSTKDKPTCTTQAKVLREPNFVGLPSHQPPNRKGGGCTKAGAKRGLNAEERWAHPHATGPSTESRAKLGWKASPPAQHDIPAPGLSHPSRV